MVGALVNGFSQIGDPNTIAYLDEKQYWPFWGDGRKARRAVLPAPAQSAAGRTPGSTKATLADGPESGRSARKPRCTRCG